MGSLSEYINGYRGRHSVYNYDSPRYNTRTGSLNKGGDNGGPVQVYGVDANLEAFGRIFCGLSRWLNLKDDSEEEIIRATVRNKVVKCFQNGFNPDSFDYFNFVYGRQPLVDAAFIAQGLMRAPLIWNMLDEDTKSRIIEVFISLRRVKPYPSNWMLFASMIEAFLLDKTGICDENRLLEGINAFIYAFYVGDGVYADGINYDNNYYNSYVIHPMLMDILLLLQDKGLHSIHEVYTVFMSANC